MRRTLSVLLRFPGRSLPSKSLKSSRRTFSAASAAPTRVVDSADVPEDTEREVPKILSNPELERMYVGAQTDPSKVAGLLSRRLESQYPTLIQGVGAKACFGVVKSIIQVNRMWRSNNNQVQDLDEKALKALQKYLMEEKKAAYPFLIDSDCNVDQFCNYPGKLLHDLIDTSQMDVAAFSALKTLEERENSGFLDPNRIPGNITSAEHKKLLMAKLQSLDAKSNTALLRNPTVSVVGFIPTQARNTEERENGARYIQVFEPVLLEMPNAMSVKTQNSSAASRPIFPPRDFNDIEKCTEHLVLAWKNYSNGRSNVAPELMGMGPDSVYRMIAMIRSANTTLRNDGMNEVCVIPSMKRQHGGRTMKNEETGEENVPWSQCFELKELN